MPYALKSPGMASPSITPIKRTTSEGNRKGGWRRKSRRGNISRLISERLRMTGVQLG